jgi:hypothetical protein
MHTCVCANTCSTCIFVSSIRTSDLPSTGARGFVCGHGRAQGLRGVGCGLTICCCGGACAYARMLVFVFGALALGSALLQQFFCGCYCPCSYWFLTRSMSPFSHTAKEKRTNTTRSWTLFCTQPRRLPPPVSHAGRKTRSCFLHATRICLPLLSPARNHQLHNNSSNKRGQNGEWVRKVLSLRTLTLHREHRSVLIHPDLRPGRPW